ncbi:ABC transporter ATP-binding protein [Alkalinema sp. FACHB-956]|uniref:ABC transporter ATP-binding protein n=1 Tax=Alkalinema sp. FACHB-956 TaxID=2692768 RepID=UPI001683A89F|nr:ABC transporter ATP-binding protein [Alkalinema sp. FACHB-956]MBD2326506.1 ABC transporter ATP-binding protein [Alkalinema sp. FACHB-956]
MAQTVPHNYSETGLNLGFDIELRKVFKVFNGEAAVRGIDLNIRRGEFFSILGPSGCGKTTTLRLIAGFELPTAGDILLRGQSMVDVPPYRRPVNTVFQSYALFNHLTVEENIAFGLRLKKMGKGEIQNHVREALNLVKMEEWAKRFPSQLSGGQQQRVALARALVNRPTVLLLDEPLGALDLKLRKAMQMELKTLHRELGLTFVMVTHDQEEALSLSDRIAVMNRGRVEQMGTPSQIYERPNTRFVAEFIGDTNLIMGKIEGAHPTMLWIISTEGRQFKVIPVDTGNKPLTSGAVVISVRPEKIQLQYQPPADGLNWVEGYLKNLLYLGTHVNCQLQLTSGETLVVQLPHGFEIPSPNTRLYAVWRPEDGLALPNDS